MARRARDRALPRSGGVRGRAAVVVGEDTLVARKAVVVATGTAAAVPPIDGLAEAAPWTNREATTAARIPERLLVLGGGVVGVEMAQAFSSLGSSVVVVEAAPRLLAAEEEYVSEEIEAALVSHGVDVRTGTKAISVSRGDAGQVSLGLEGGDEIRGDELLVAVGRRPRTAELALEKAGIAPDERGFLDVDDQLRVGGSDWLYAIGDVNGRALLTHMGKYQARVAADAILGKDVTATCDKRGSPRVIFTDPEVAAVGLTLAGAQEAGIDARAVDVDDVGERRRQLPRTEYAGHLPARDRRAPRVLVGATFVGTEIAEMLHAATVAVVGEVPLETLWHAVPAFPTRNEVWLKLLEDYGL